MFPWFISQEKFIKWSTGLDNDAIREAVFTTWSKVPTCLPETPPPYMPKRIFELIDKNGGSTHKKMVCSGLGGGWYFFGDVLLINWWTSLFSWFVIFSKLLFHCAFCPTPLSFLDIVALLKNPLNVQKINSSLFWTGLKILAYIRNIYLNLIMFGTVLYQT